MPHQPGDPVIIKRAERLPYRPGGTLIAAVIGAVERPDSPHHLLLGSQAHDGAMAKLSELKRCFEAWEAVSRGADYPTDAADRAA